MSRLVLHLDADRVAEGEKRRLRLAVPDRLDGALFGDARIADAALADRAPRPAILSLLETVPEPMIVPAPSGRGFALRVRSACGKSNVMSTPAFGRPKGLPLRLREQRQVQFAALPCVAQLVRRHRDRREGR